MLNHRVFTYFFIWGVTIAIAFLPFLFGMMRPSFTDGNPYSIFFSMFNFPVTFVFGWAIDELARALWESPTGKEMILSQFYVTVAFWSIFGGIIGLSKDLRGNRGG